MEGWGVDVRGNWKWEGKSMEEGRIGNCYYYYYYYCVWKGKEEEWKAE